MKTKFFILFFFIISQFGLQAHPDDIYWSKDFGIPTTDQVRATLIDGDYVYYNEFAGLIRWNLKTHQTDVLGLSSLGIINTIVKHNQYIYIGGTFENFAGVNADFIARWDGNKWEKVVDSIDGRVNTICFDDEGNLWIGGMFSHVNGISSPYIAFRKNGTWQDIPKLNNQVRSIINVNGDIYVGGDFYYKGQLDTYISCVVKWDNDKWTNLGGLGNQCGSRVFSLAASPDGKIYAGGVFFKAGDKELSENVAMFDGSDWQKLGSGLDDMVFTLEWHNGKIYAGGYFDKSGENDCKKIAAFDNGEWHNVDGGIAGDEYPTVLCLVSVDNQYLYCGGNFNKAGNLDTWSFIRLNDAGKWENFLPVTRNGSVGGVLCLTIDKKDNILYAGGGFVKTGRVVSYGIAKFDGQQWQGCNNGLTPTSNSAYYMQAVNDTVYFTGWFSFADTVKLRNVARWLDKQKTWEPIGNGIEGADFDLGPICVTDKDIYVGGDFKNVENGDDTITVNYITRWDGEKWNSLDGGISRTNNRTPIIKQIVRNKNLLYIIGLFNLAGRGIVDNVAVWDIDKLRWVSSQINIAGIVNTLFIDGDDFYFGGSFQTAGNLENVNNVVKWNRKTNTWTKLAEGVDGSVAAITKWGDDIYIAGTFPTASGIACNSVAKYVADENKFVALGSGITNANRPGRISAMIVYKNELYLVGTFTTAGNGIASSNIAKWTKAPLSVYPNHKQQKDIFIITPNPATDYIEISLDNHALNVEVKNVKIYDVLGQCVMTVPIHPMPRSHRMNIEGLPAGVYFVRVVGQVLKFVKL